MKGLGTFLIGFALAAILAGLTAWGYNAGQVTVEERVDAPGVILHNEEGG